MSWLAILLGIGTAHAACPADTAVLRSDVAAAVKAYEAWEWETFDRRVDRVRADLACLSEPATMHDASAVHELFARVGGRQKDEALAERAFRGLLAIDPDYEPEADLAVPGSLLQRAYEKACEAGSGTCLALPDPEALPDFEGGVWMVDGIRYRDRVEDDRLALVQLVDARDGIHSWYFEGDGLPADLLPSRPEATGTVAAAETPTADLPPTETPAAQGGSLSRSLLFGGVAAGAVAVAGFATAEVLEGEMMETADRDEAASIYRTGRILTLASTGVGAVGGGLVVGAVVSGRW